MHSPFIDRDTEAQQLTQATKVTQLVRSEGVRTFYLLFHLALEDQRNVSSLLLQRSPEQRSRHERAGWDGPLRPSPLRYSPWGV